MEAHALCGRGWTISAITVHLGRDRETAWAYLHGPRVPGDHPGRGDMATRVAQGDRCRAAAPTARGASAA